MHILMCKMIGGGIIGKSELIFLFLLALLCLNAAYASSSNTIEQQANQDEIKESDYDFNTVQSLIDNAEDDSIYLEDETYTSNGDSIKIDKDIKIYGKNTILDGKNTSGIFTVSSGKKLSLINISVVNSKETAIKNNGELTIEDSIFKSNEGDYGGVVLNRGNLIIKNSKFSYNHAIQGGVIYNYKNVSIENSEFIRNSASHKCGVIYSNTGEVNITGSFFQYNDGSDEGGCIFLPGGSLNVDSSQFISNKAQSYGGAIDNSGGTAVIRNSIFDRNRAYGAGAIDNSGDTTVINSNLTNNKATINGGAIDNNGRLSMTGCILENNTAGAKGGAVMARANTSITHSFILNNNASIAEAIYGDEEDIGLNDNWWGCDNPDFSSLLNFEIDDDFRWIISDDTDKNLIDTLTKTINRNNEIEDLNNPELLPPHESGHSSNDSDEGVNETASNGRGDLNNETIDNDHESLLESPDAAENNSGSMFVKNALSRTDNETKTEYSTETASKTSLKSIDNAWILLIVLLLALVYAAYKKYRN